MRLPPGKVPIDILEEVVFRYLGAERGEVVLGPGIGFDCAVVDVGGKSLIVTIDPITGAVERIGWLAVNINANDIATTGVEPALFFPCILFPENVDKKIVETVCIQMDRAAKDLGMAIVGGHSEVTPGLKSTIVIGCAIGIAEKGKYVTPRGAKPEDKLILTKSAGIEGTAILASDREERLRKTLSQTVLSSAKEFYNQISVVKDSIKAFETGGVNAMHDPTEGGVIGGVYEMAEASNLGVMIFEERVPVRQETLEICRFFNIDPLYLVSSGALLVSSKPKFTEKIVRHLERNRIPTSVIGEFLEDRRRRVMVSRDEKTQALPKPSSDHLWLALARE